MAIPTPNLTSSKTGTFYLAYGSNLSVHQMRLRLPNTKSSSDPIAVAKLPNYKWIICERGYANIVSIKDISKSVNTSSEPNGSISNTQSTNLNYSTVYGIIYNLSSEDEEVLDLYEGHNPPRNPNPEPNLDPDLSQRLIKPYLQGGWDYNKIYLDMEIIKWIESPKLFGLDSETTTIRALAYVDEFRLIPGIITTEYIGRMNRGIKESVALGLPEEWAETVLRPFIPKGIWVDDEGYIGDQRGYVVDEASATETVDIEEVVEVDGAGLEKQVTTEKDVLELRREQGVI